MTWRARIWTGISAAFMALAALVLMASTGPAQELDYTLEELERKIDESPRVRLLLASPGLDPGGNKTPSGTISTSRPA